MKKFMIAEDDLFMADMLEEVLVAAGYEVCGIARTVNERVELCERHRPDLAVMDIRLADGRLGITIAARLKYLGAMGVLHATGNVADFQLTRVDGEACLNKPYTSDDIIVVSRADESSPQGRAFITGQPVVCDDLALDASFVLPEFYEDHEIISTVDVVIRVAGEPYGILEVDSPVQHNHDEHDVNFRTGFANIRQRRSTPRSAMRQHGAPPPRPADKAKG